MVDIGYFLAWFDGYAENIKGRPTAAQWAKVKTKIAALKSPDPLRLMVAGPSQEALEAKSGDNKEDPIAEQSPPRSEGEWLQQYKAALVDLGLDEESAADETNTRDAEMNRSPIVVARETVRDYGVPV
jgi:hypothetical protein